MGGETSDQREENLTYDQAFQDQSVFPGSCYPRCLYFVVLFASF